MRLRAAALAAIVTGSVLTGLAAGGAPAGAAANPAITIRAIDRAGKVVPVTASLQSPVISPTGIDETLTSAHPTRVPRGTYNIAAWVQEPHGGAQTLVDRGITVTRSVTITFDARKGRPVRFAVNDPTVKQDAVLAEPFSPAGWDAFDTFGAPLPAVPYVVPGTMAPGEYLSLEAELTQPNVFPSPVEYVLIKVIRGVIPANLTFTVDKSKLASDRVTVRRVDPGGSDAALFEPVANGNPGDLPVLPLGQAGATPFSVEYHFTPGYRWQSMTDSGTDNINVGFTPRLGVHQYAQTFDNAAFGPGTETGPFVASSDLYTALPWGDYLLDDPTQERDSSFGMPVASSQTWLYQGSKLIAHGVNKGFSTTISATPHWYTFRAQASRGPGATLSKSLALYFNFQAFANDNQLNVFWPRIIPSGLSAWNAARHGTRTAVRIYFSDVVGDIAAHGVLVWASADGGKTWQALRVSRSGPHWTAIVTNPAASGFVSLRVQGTDANGFTTRMTVTNAYAVS
jgi:hypothetical protein